MNVLFIGGTGTISMAISRLLLSQGHTLYLLNRGNRNHGLTGNVVELTVDVNDEAAVAEMNELKMEDYERDYHKQVSCH
jgi:nucleoside-diphosphate-sugar epimerase